MLRSALTRFAPPVFSRALLCAALVLLAACKMSENEVCQIDGDCSSGLICLRARSAVRGTCQNPKTLEQDSGVTGGAAGEGPLPDAGELDGGSEDGGTAAK
jgi:hypothetical protein